MKKFSFLALAAAGLLTVGCSEKDEEVKDVQAVEEFKDGSFIGLSLQLPTADQGFTRANDDLSNGTAEEFAVKNATLYIFSTPDDSSNPDEVATFVGYVSLGTAYTKDNQEGISPDEWGKQTAVMEGTKITSTYNEAAQIPNELASKIKTDANRYYAYVILNHNGQLPTVSDGSTQGSSATTFAQFSKYPFTEIGADIAEKQNIHDGGLLMTSSPISNKAGGSNAPENGAKYTTLVQLNKSNIFSSAEEAKNNPAGCVYVERAAVKITVEDGRTDNSLSNSNGSYTANILGWQVINYEPTYYNTRQIESTWGPWKSDLLSQTSTPSTIWYRFVSNNKFEPTLPSGQTHTEAYRTYFAKDVQYDANATLRKTKADANKWIAVGKQNHAYTTENTFDVAHQTWRNTTMVTLKVKLVTTNDGGTTEGVNFYTVGKGSQTMFTTLDDVKSQIQNIVKSDPEVFSAYNALLNQISNNNPGKTITPGLNVAIEEPTEGKTGVPFTITLAYTIDGANADYTGEGEAALRTTLEGKIADVTSKDALLVSYYKSGDMYYNARIKHYGDIETPWNAAGDYVTGGGTNIKEIYGLDNSDDTSVEKANQRFLGRYGVVRDNWYKLSIDKIGKIGSAEPVDPSVTTPDTPDDEIENFISVHVHIVPWVLREQSVSF